ncbi:MAG: hypothetical protein HKO07_04805 [Pseudomonadales bacterium]|nr:hypothetical protein [Pseudomonadales bacterium]
MSVRKFAIAGSSLNGSIALAALPRLSGAVLAASEPFAVAIDFAENEFGKRTLKVRIDGTVALECQRCLKPVDVAVTADSNLTVVAHDEEARARLRDLDPLIVEGDELEVFALIEDELLMALPIIALHPQPDCAGPGNELGASASAVSQGSDESAQVQPGEQRENPFAVLRDLKQRNDAE